MTKHSSKFKFSFALILFFFAFSLIAGSAHSHSKSESNLQEHCVVCHLSENSKNKVLHFSAQGFSLQLVSSPVLFAKLSQHDIRVPLVKCSQAPPV